MTQAFTVEASPIVLLAQAAGGGDLRVGVSKATVEAPSSGSEQATVEASSERK